MKRETPPNRRHAVLKSTIIGGCLGLIAAAFLPRSTLSLSRPEQVPLPHQIAKFPGGIALRFSMVHDVIHERFPKHGPAYYRHRNQLVTAQLAKLGGIDSARTAADLQWRLMDDLAVGHVHLGEFDQAIAAARDKLERQQALNITGPHLYPTYANLGTAMMIQAIVRMSAPTADDAAKLKARTELTESLVWIKKSIEINPQAHFGREVWQVVLGEFLLAAMDNPNLLATHDMVGHKLAANAFAVQTGAVDDFNVKTGRSVRSHLENESQSGPEMRELLRRSIADLGLNLEKGERRSPSQPERAPFDEPTLAIVGMWRYGGGANVHFSLALAEIMNRVGQPYIAWAAFERTIRLIESSGLPAEARQSLAKHCHERQSGLSDSYSTREPPAALRAAFDAELKAGLDYQAVYQKYEADRIAAGASIDDPNFYDAFLAAHGDIATAPGVADFRTYESGLQNSYVPFTLAGAGLCGFCAAVEARIKRRGAPTTQ